MESCAAFGESTFSLPAHEHHAPVAVTLFEAVAGPGS